MLRPKKSKLIMSKLTISVQKLHPEAIIPHHATQQSAGVDLCACLSENIILKPGHRCLVSTGLAIALPEGYEAQIRPRSGLALKHGITVLNSPGTVDADYRGEIKILLINLSQENFMIEHQTRIAQMIIAHHQKINFDLVTNLGDTERAEDGFGSTGTHKI
jgi:dUTP pyrophosphatase